MIDLGLNTLFCFGGGGVGKPYVNVLGLRTLYFLLPNTIYSVLHFFFKPFVNYLGLRTLWLSIAEHSLLGSRFWFLILPFGNDLGLRDFTSSPANAEQIINLGEGGGALIIALKP